MTTIPERVSKLEGAYEQVDQRLGDLTGLLESLRDEMNSLLNTMDSKLTSMDSKVESKFNTLIIVMATSGAAIVGTLIAIALRL